MGLRARLAAWALAWGAAAGLPGAVLIDPGHGGEDPGVVAEGFREADFTLALAKDLAVRLRQAGLEARLTREADRGLSLSARVQMANQMRPKVLVSLHANASFQRGAQGARVFVPAEGPVDDPVAPLWEHAARLQARASRELGLAVAAALGQRGPRAVQVLKMGLFRGLAVPACVVELGFASDPASLAELKDPAWRAGVAERLAASLAAHLGAPAAPAGGDHAAP